MLEIKIKGKVYDIPSSWEEVKFVHYCKFVDTQETEEFKKMSSERQFIKLIASLNDDSEELYANLEMLSLVNLNAIAEHCVYLQDMEALNNLAKKKPTAKDKNEIKFGEETFAIYSDYKNMTIGDKEAFERAKAQLEHNFKLNPQLIGLAFLLRKKTKDGLEEFNLDTFMDNINRVIPKSGWTLAEVMYYVSFFLIGGKNSLNTSKDFSIQIKSSPSISVKKKSSKPKKSKKSI